MDIKIESAKKEDKQFILNANKEINEISGLDDSVLADNIDTDIFGKNKLCFCIVAKYNDKTIGMSIYSYIYKANLGKGIYLSQVYVDESYRQKGILKMFFEYIINKEKDCKYITCLIGEENDAMRIALNKFGCKKSKLESYFHMIK
jgi:GNAT superfamily N-acetyltransferase